MATLIRVKRRLGEEPLEAILVRPKRRRVEGRASEGDGVDEAKALPPPTVLERVATLDSEDASIEPSALREYKKGWELRQRYKKLGPSEGWREAGRRQVKERGRESRYLLTASHRGNITTTDLDKQEDGHSSTAAEDKSCITEAAGREEKIQFYDAHISHAEEDVITCNGQPMESEKYVYDIYYSPDNMDWTEFICEQPKLMMEDKEEDKEEDDEEDDENAEDNWRNEYPEEEDDEEDEYRDEYSYWDRPSRGRGSLKCESDESFDADEYEEDECSFDEHGSLLTNSVAHLGDQLATTVLSSGEESESG